MVIHSSPDLGEVVDRLDQLKDGSLRGGSEVVTPDQPQVNETRNVLLVRRILDDEALVAADVEGLEIEELLLHTDPLLRLLPAGDGDALHIWLHDLEAEISAGVDAEPEGLDLAHQIRPAQLGPMHDLGLGRRHLPPHLALRHFPLFQLERLGHPRFADDQVHDRWFGRLLLLSEERQDTYRYGLQNNGDDERLVHEPALTTHELAELQPIGRSLETPSLIDIRRH